MPARLRAASSPQAGPILLVAQSAQGLHPRATRLVGPNALERATRIGALVLGLSLLTRVPGLTATRAEVPQVLERTLVKSIQALVDQR